MELGDKIKIIVAIFWAMFSVYLLSNASKNYLHIELNGLEPLLSTFDKLLNIILNLG